MLQSIVNGVCHFSDGRTLPLPEPMELDSVITRPTSIMWVVRRRPGSKNYLGLTSDMSLQLAALALGTEPPRQLPPDAAC